MKDFLESKGFKLKQYPDGKFWVWKTNKKGLKSWEQAVLQCTEDFRDFTFMDSTGWVHDGFSEEEFKKLVDEVQNNHYSD